MATRIPSLRNHKPSQQAVVSLNSRDHYCGPWGSKKAQVEYQRLVGEWLAGGGAPRVRLPPRPRPRLQPHTLVAWVNPVPEPSYRLVQQIQAGQRCSTTCGGIAARPERTVERFPPPRGIRDLTLGRESHGALPSGVSGRPGAGARHLAPLIRLSLCPIRPKRARFVTFRVLRDCGLGHDAYNA